MNFILWSIAHAATTSAIVGGDLGGGDLVVQDGDTLEGTFTNVGNFVVPEGVTVTVQGGVPLAVFANTIEIDGVIDGLGSGEIGGKGGTEGATDGKGTDGGGEGGGPGGPLEYPGPTDYYGGGGGGGGNGGKGGQGGMYYSGKFAAGGITMGEEGNQAADVLMGAGGGGGAGYGGTLFGIDAEGGKGGRGGAAIHLVAGTITVNGTIVADGASGLEAPGYISSGGGGGSGGTVVLDGGTVSGNGTITANGGRGGDPYSNVISIHAGAGGGAGGRIKVFHGALTADFVTSVLGGPPGENSLASGYAEEPSRGEDGTVWYELTDPDIDRDGVLVPDDNCPSLPNPDQLDQDDDGDGDACDACPLDALDSDLDGVCDSLDQCLGGNDKIDGDADGQADDCDCAPEDPRAKTNGLESCDGFDNNCDETLDPDGSIGSRTWFVDLDGDGFGQAAQNEYGCYPSLNFVDVGGDCNDDSPTENPGAAEFCDGIDNDCDGLVDQSCTDLPTDTGSACSGCQSGANGAGAGMAALGALLLIARRRRV